MQILRRCSKPCNAGCVAVGAKVTAEAFAFALPETHRDRAPWPVLHGAFRRFPNQHRSL